MIRCGTDARKQSLVILTGKPSREELEEGFTEPGENQVLFG